MVLMTMVLFLYIIDLMKISFNKYSTKYFKEHLKIIEEEGRFIHPDELEKVL